MNLLRVGQPRMVQSNGTPTDGFDVRARRRRICFVAPTTYPVLSGDRSIREVGGAQVQQSILAREFVRRGYDVSMIAMNYGQPDGVEIDGVKILRAHSPTEGIPVLRFVHPRLTSIWNAMRRADADIYYQRTAGALGGFVVAYARYYRRCSVYAAASDRDFFPDVPNVKYARDRALHRFALRNADFIVAQTQTQRELCYRHYGRNPVVIPSCYGHEGRAADQSGPVIWAGNIIEVKRPELFIELARRLPEYRFKLVGGQGAALSNLKNLATGVQNIELTGFVPFADIERHFDGASILVNTSSNEGFPNTFLQAWSRGMPTVSFFNPGASSEAGPVGFTSVGIDEMAAHVKTLKENPAIWLATSDKLRNLFSHNFSIQRAVDAYESMLAHYSRRVATSNLHDR